MQFEYDNVIKLNSDKDTRSLHERRWDNAKKKASDILYKRAAEAAGVEQTQQADKYDYDEILKATESVTIPSDDARNETKGKNTKFRPLVYYTVNDALNNCMKQYKDQAKQNIELIKANKESKGQRLAVKADLKDVLGQFSEGRRAVKIGPVSSVAFHIFVREWCGYICYFEISEANYGVKEMKRRGYNVEKVSVIYYQKNGVGLNKELILKQPFMTVQKHPSKNPKEDND